MHDDKHNPGPDDKPPSTQGRKQPAEPSDEALFDLDEQALEAELDKLLIDDSDLSTADGPLHEPLDPSQLKSFNQELEAALASSEALLGQGVDDFDLEVEQMPEPEAGAASHREPPPATKPPETPTASNRNEAETDISKLFANLNDEQTRTPDYRHGDYFSKPRPPAAGEASDLEQDAASTLSSVEQLALREAAQAQHNERARRQIRSRGETPDAAHEQANRGRRGDAEAPQENATLPAARQPSSTNRINPVHKAWTGLETETQGQPPSSLPFAAAVVAAIALAAAVVSAWLVYDQGQRINALQAALQQQATSIEDDRTGPAMDQIFGDIQRLENQLDDIRGALIETQHASEQRIQSAMDYNAPLLATLTGKVNALEQQLQALPGRKQTTGQTASPARTASNKPAPKPAAAATPSSTGSGDKPAGDWVISLASLSKRSAANKELARLNSLGIDATLRPAKVGGKTRYRLVVPGFATKKAAQREAAQISKKSGLDQIWIKREQR